MINPVKLSSEIEKRYRAYLKTSFYFRDPQLRQSFESVLDSGRLRRGPYLESTPVFQTGLTASALFNELLGSQIDAGLFAAIRGERPLYTHQERAVRAAFARENVVVATGTGSGKTESFLYPILLEALSAV